jgi:hypothetical protein
MTSNERVDSTERYYAEMEAARNTAMDAYFIARPQILRTHALESIFRAGFERAFAMMWAAANAVSEVTADETLSRHPQERADHLRQIANIIESRPVLGHWPAMMAKPDADFLRSVADRGSMDPRETSGLICYSPYPHFAPLANCYSCRRDIYAHERAQEDSGRALITSCPWCHHSFCE